MKLIGGRGAVRSRNNQNHGFAYRLPHFLLPRVFALFAHLRFFCIHYVSTSGDSQKTASLAFSFVIGKMLTPHLKFNPEIPIPSVSVDGGCRWRGLGLNDF